MRQFRTFRVGLEESGTDSFNRFLRNVRALSVDKRFVEAGEGSFWVLLVEYEVAQENASGRKERQASFRDGSWQPSTFHVFTVYEPKERLISAAPLRDRVAHHALMNIVAPILDKRQIFHSYACREGKGVHACVAQAYTNQRRYAYFLRMDIRQFFPSIKHGILLGKLRREIWDASTLHALENILEHGGTAGVGLPIGNLTSQHFANFYLSYLDHFVLQELRPGAYVRYMDDFVLWANERACLRQAQQRITEFVGKELLLHPKAAATELKPSHGGLVFLGCRILPWQIRFAQRSLRRLRCHLRQWRWELAHGFCEEYLARKTASVMGWTRLANTYALRKSLQVANLLTEIGV